MRNLFHASYLMVLLLVASRVAPAATLEVDHSRSKITVAVVTTVHDFTGEVTVYDATIECDPTNDLPAKAEVIFDFRDLKTGIKGRDKDMLKWLKYDSNPKASFHLTGWKQDGTNSVALGDLTIHGITQAIQLPTVVRRDGDEYQVTGTAKLNYCDFQLPVIRKALFFTVNPHLTVHFHLQGTTIDKK